MQFFIIHLSRSSSLLQIAMTSYFISSSCATDLWKLCIRWQLCELCLNYANYHKLCKKIIINFSRSREYLSNGILLFKSVKRLRRSSTETIHRKNNKNKNNISKTKSSPLEASRRTKYFYIYLCAMCQCYIFFYSCIHLCVCGTGFS